MTREYRITSENITPPEDGDCVLPPDDLAQEISRLQFLGGLGNRARLQEYRAPEGSNISKTANEKAELQRKHNIQPGTPEWFQLWFSLPYMTGEKPIGKDSSSK